MQNTKWLTVAEASLLANEMTLNRTGKTIRSWCRCEHVIAEKQTHRSGEIWVIDRESLIVKIKSEIEFRDQQRTPNPVRTPSEPVQTGADSFEPVRTRVNQGEQGSQQVPASDVAALKSEIAGLKMEVKLNERLANQFKKEYLKGQEALQAQARYIGHIETNLARLGERPDQAFLKAPVPKFGPSDDAEDRPEMTAPEIIKNDRPHPNQGRFHTG